MMNISSKIACLILTLGSLTSLNLLASEVVETKVITIENGQDVESRPLEHMFRNPVLNSGYMAGADALNRSLDSLMESLFYNLLDNEVKEDISPSFGIGASFKRDLFQAENGAWVVLDRVGLGPYYDRELYKLKKIPIKLGANQTAEVYDIYLRTDPMRVSESTSLPFWRQAINNWFGVLPLLETILPPSFNANEMYDPVRRFETPFVFPASKQAFDQMELGSIKSYAFTGGVNLTLESTDGMGGIIKDIKTGSSAFDVSLPYGVFRTGSYRVNVLKRDHNIAWIGITDLKQFGHRLSSSFGRTYFLMPNSIPLWKGVPTDVFPLDISFESSSTYQLTQVYAYDMRIEEAQRAYLYALRGDLEPSQISWLRNKEDKIDSGVQFLLTRSENRDEVKNKVGPGVFVAKRQIASTDSKSEIEITDSSGKFNVLEARQESSLNKWDILTGGSSVELASVADLKVRKVFKKDQATEDVEYFFDFEPHPENIEVSLNLRIKDRFVDVEDFDAYLDVVELFSGFKIKDDLPKIPVRDEASELKRRRQIYFTTDLDTPDTLHVTSSLLGAIEISSAIRFSRSDLMGVANASNEEKWKVFCDVYQVDSNRCLGLQQSAIIRTIDRIGSLMSFVPKTMALQVPRLDALDEIWDALNALACLQKNPSAIEFQKCLRQLLDTDHPIQLAKALVGLMRVEKIFRSVQISTTPKGHGPASAKELFGKINGKRFSAGDLSRFSDRVDKSREVDSKFDPTHLTFFGIRPVPRRLSLRHITSFELSPLSLSSEKEIPNLILEVEAPLVRGKDIKAYVFVRLVETGRINLAKFKLVESVIEPSDLSIDFDFQTGLLRVSKELTGERGLVSGILASEILKAGGDFRLSLSYSYDRVHWSEEKHLDFRLQDGKLFK
jgi:hypothetical protein